MSPLKRSLGLGGLIAASAGLALASSVYTAVAQVGAMTGPGWVWLPVAIGGGIAALAAWNFGLLARWYPQAGGVQVYVREALGDRAAVTVSLLYVFLALAAGAAEAAVFSRVLELLAGATGSPFLAALPGWLWIILVMGFFYAINLRGVELAGRVQQVTTYGMFLVLGLISAAALPGTASSAASLPGPGSDAASLLLPGAAEGNLVAGAEAILTAGPFEAWMQAIAFAIYLFIGFEWVTPLAEEARDARQLGRAMTGAIGLLAAGYALFGLALTRYLTPAELVSSSVPHLLFGARWGLAGLLLMGGVSALATFTSLNAGLLGISRLVYAMGRAGILPKVLGRVHLVYFTPWAALTAIFLLELGMALWTGASGRVLVWILAAAAAEAVVYALTGWAVLKEGDRRGFWKHIPPWRKSAVLFATALFAFLAVMTLLPPTPPAAGIYLFLALGVSYGYARLRERRLQQGRTRQA